jgi:hypothetical protein
MVSGAPPVGPNNMAQCFNASAPIGGVAGKQDLSEAEIEGFVQAMFGESSEPFLRDAVARADGRFRKRLFEAARAGEGVDQRLVVESSPIPLAVVNGGADRIVNLRYRRLCQFVGRALSSLGRAGACAVLGSAERLRSCSRTLPAGRRNRPGCDSNVVNCP